MQPSYPLMTDLFTTDICNHNCRSNTFGSIKLEEGASIMFTATVLNIADLVADKGSKNNSYTYIRFGQNTSIRVSGKVSIGSQVLINP